MFLARKGLHSLKDLYVEGSFASFNQLRAIFGLVSSDFFWHFQLRDFARTHSPAFPLIPTTTGIDRVLLANTTTKGHVSYLYDLLLPANELTMEKIKSNWENELQVTLSDQFCSKALKNIKLSSSCMRLGLIQFKVLHRIHYSKPKLSKMYPDTVEDKCNRCSLSPCDLTHMFRTCLSYLPSGIHSLRLSPK